LKIIFAGTPEVAKDMLSNLIENKLPIFHVYTQPDRAAGRGRHLTPSPVKTLALAHNIPVSQPLSLKTPEEIQALQQLAPDLLVVVAYGMLLPPQILEIPRYGCINVHFSLLPRWRGASPVQQAILAGDQQTGVSIMQMDAGLDTGPVIKTATCDILATDTSEDLFSRLTMLAQPLLLDVIHHIDQAKNQAQPQDERKKTYAGLIEKHQARINWSKSAVEIDRLIRAFYPWPIAQTQLGDQILRIFKAEVSDNTTQKKPGLILTAQKEGLDVATGLGVLRITQVQLPGKRQTDIRDLLNGHAAQLQPGMTLLE
jgi:methionyl-tRNA formyltransferase